MPSGVPQRELTSPCRALGAHCSHGPALWFAHRGSAPPGAACRLRPWALLAGRGGGRREGCHTGACADLGWGLSSQRRGGASLSKRPRDTRQAAPNGAEHHAFADARDGEEALSRKHGQQRRACHRRRWQPRGPATRGYRYWGPAQSAGRGGAVPPSRRATRPLRCAAPRAPPPPARAAPTSRLAPGRPLAGGLARRRKRWSPRPAAYWRVSSHQAGCCSSQRAPWPAPLRRAAMTDPLHSQR